MKKPRPSAADLRRHADSGIVKAVDFVADPFDEAQRRAKRSTLENVGESGQRKKPHGRAAKRAAAIFRATGEWVR